MVTLGSVQRFLSQSRTDIVQTGPGPSGLWLMDLNGCCDDAVPPVWMVRTFDGKCQLTSLGKEHEPFWS